MRATKSSVQDDEEYSEHALLDRDNGFTPSTPPSSSFERIGNGWFQYTAISLLGLGNASDAVELLAISYILPELPDITSAQKGALSAAMFGGMLVGGMVAGLLSDRLGRKPCLLASLFINAFFGLASAFAPNWVMLVVFRVLSGVGVGGSVPSVWTMATEILPLHRRGFYITIVAWWWMVGTIGTAGLAWIMLGALDLSWRWFAGACAIPSLVCGVLSIFVLPESPRFFLITRSYAEAIHVLDWISRTNGKGPCRLTEDDLLRQEKADPDTDDAGEYADDEVAVASPHVEKRLRVKEERVVHDHHFEPTSASSSSSARRKQRTTPKALLAPLYDLLHPSIARTTVLLTIIWWALNFGWYGLTLWLPTLFAKVGFAVDIYQDTFLVSASNLPGNIMVSLIIDRVGRKNLLGSTLVISTCLVVVLAFAQESKVAVQRTTAMGVLTSSGRLAALTAQFVNGALIDSSVFLLLIVTSANLIVGAGAAFFLVDTAHRRLADDVRVINEEDDPEKRDDPIILHSPHRS
ncbi:transporter, major facilitator subfamily protein [Acanthamoeba castellanii str. Neff]|uniref:Transporter, major facilitator subfamily protein n=1 Tax=Acanthamoeba castellanii (strain ATCC 30010 / Neff) TaxID=1257118 RepID=L8GVP8_ACACF|nr:transporter, major facilitator subfamily protein [Acanthamoeba castellanii str. Neff]ELR16663.1 transporter, major facilitator subfamily protein [Acanthamoeba castellanii str. Neff]